MLYLEHKLRFFFWECIDQNAIYSDGPDKFEQYLRYYKTRLWEDYRADQLIQARARELGASK